jgi:DNA-directed RNA polymerase specialized sigma24 family protein
VTNQPFQLFVETHRDAVARFLVATVGPDDADDVLQETLIAALRSYASVRTGGNPRAWLLTIARNTAIDAHRARVRRPVPVAAPDAGSMPGGFGDGPDEELWSAVRDLPPKQRAAVALRYVNDLSHREIARVLDCSEAAARRSLHEGLEKLREEWA